MQHVKQYIKANKQQLLGIFASMGSEGVIEATKVFSFLGSAFDTQQIKLLKNGKSFFVDDQNAQIMQTLIEDFYMAKNGKDTKFYMYRVTFQFNQVVQIIKYWLQKDTSIQVMYKGAVQQQYPLSKPPNLDPTPQKSQPKQSNQIKQQQEQKSDNQFMPEIEDIPGLIKNYRNQIEKYQLSIKTQQLNQEEIKGIRDKIKELETKILFLEERLEKKKKNADERKRAQTQVEIKQPQTQESNSVSPRKSVMSLSPAKIDSTLKIIFDFYAKQLHVTGVKASFQRIQHQSSRINYQKLVHFLKQYKIFPSDSKDQKKLHNFYVKCSSSTRDLTYDGFLSLLEKLADIIITQPLDNSIGKIQTLKKSKFDILKHNIIQQRKKNKVLNNPFHSLQKQDFRIDKSSLRYQFKLMPLNGKDPEQITKQLQARKQQKHEKRQEKQKQEMSKKIRYIKKLQAIDPFHPLVQKNRHLIKEKSVIESEPIVSMDNIEMFRDKSFDLKLLGIQDEGNVNVGKSQVKKGNVGGNNSYLIKNRVKEVEKLELDKMKNLMSGIIERSNAKLEKMGISPTKKSSIQ